MTYILNNIQRHLFPIAPSGSLVPAPDPYLPGNQPPGPCTAPWHLGQLVKATAGQAGQAPWRAKLT